MSLTKKTILRWTTPLCPAFTALLVLTMTAANAQDLEISLPTDVNNRVRVSVALFVADVDSIDTANQSFEAKVYVVSRWRETPGWCTTDPEQFRNH